MAGLGVLIGADCVLAWGDSWQTLAPGVALWGLHLGMTQGLLATMVANAAPADLRGTAFGFFNLLSGLALLERVISCTSIVRLGVMYPGLANSSPRCTSSFSTPVRLTATRCPRCSESA